MVFLVRRGPIISDMPLQNMISSMLPLHMHICKRWASFLIPCSSDRGMVVDMGSDQSPPLVHRSSDHWGRHRCRSPHCLHLHEVSSKLVQLCQRHNSSCYGQFLFREISTPKLRGTLVILMPAAANTGQYLFISSFTTQIEP